MKESAGSSAAAKSVAVKEMPIAISAAAVKTKSPTATTERHDILRNDSLTEPPREAGGSSSEALEQSKDCSVVGDGSAQQSVRELRKTYYSAKSLDRKGDEDVGTKSSL